MRVETTASPQWYASRARRRGVHRKPRQLILLKPAGGARGMLPTRVPWAVVNAVAASVIPAWCRCHSSPQRQCVGWLESRGEAALVHQYLDGAQILPSRGFSARDPVSLGKRTT